MSGVVNRRLRPLLLIAVPSIAVLAALLFWLWSGRYVTTENAYVKAHLAQISAEVSQSSARPRASGDPALTGTSSTANESGFPLTRE